jgi:hypothetical protein
MLEDQVAFLLQKYLGNYVRGLSKEALKISVWRGQSGRLAATSLLIRPSLPLFTPTPPVITLAVWGLV